MYITLKGIVLRDVRYKESDKILTVFSDTVGKITVSAHGALSKKSKIAAVCQHLTYSEFVLDCRNGRYSIKEATVIEPFSCLRADYPTYSLACYFSECLLSLSADEIPDEPVLRIMLNALYALDRKLYPAEQIKAAFELKLLSELGYCPDLFSCSVCGSKDIHDPVFSYENGCVCCYDCRHNISGNMVRIDTRLLKILRFILSSDVKHFISFRGETQELHTLANIAEKYLLYHTEKYFSTLDYWKNIKNDLL